MFWKRGGDGNQARRVAGEVNAYRASRGRVRSLLVVSVPSRDETCVVKSSAMDEREEIVASPPYGLRGWRTGGRYETQTYELPTVFGRKTHRKWRRGGKWKA